MDAAVTDAHAADYDGLIKGEINIYNKKHHLTVDWELIKAMVFVESGGPSAAAWSKRAMQIGNPGDSGYAVLKNPEPRHKIVATTEILRDVKQQKIDDPKLNIRAGIAYVFIRMAHTEFQQVLSSSKVEAYTAANGDSFAAVASKQGTTVDVLRGLNPGKEKKKLKVGDVLHFVKASMEWVITGWKDFDPKELAAAYNGGGDKKYAEKVEYVWDLF